MWSLIGVGDSGIDVECMTLDEMFDEGGYGRPDLVKIDAEGAEVDILRGASRLLADTDAAVVVEYGAPESVRELEALAAGRRVELLSDHHALLRRT